MSVMQYALSIRHSKIVHQRISGGYCGRVPPLPIPNREVKPACADGTAMQCGRVGSRLLFKSEALIQQYESGLLFCMFSCFCGKECLTLQPPIHFFNKQSWNKPASSNDDVKLSFIEELNVEPIKAEVAKPDDD